MQMMPRPRSRFLAISAVSLSTLLTPTAQGQTAPWASIPTHSPAASLQRLPPTERTTIYKILRPELGPLFQGEAASVADDAIRGFRAERINLGGVSAVAVQPSGNELCGATGNCAFWIVDLLHRRVLLRAQAVGSYAIDPLGPRAVPDIVTSAHASAFEQEWIRWAFTSGHYEQQSCAMVTNADEDGKPLPQPKITPHPCSPEGN